MDDPILTPRFRRVTLMGVPIDSVMEEDLPQAIIELMERTSFSYIIFLDYPKFMKARRDLEYQTFVKQAGLVIPVSRILERACHFLRLDSVRCYHPFEFIIKVLGILEEKRKSLYVLGEKHEGVQKIASTMRTSFPYINLVGRHAGFYGRDKESSILKAIQKATPSLLLVGPGIPGREKWFFRQKDLPVKIGIYSEESFKIMAGRKKRPSKKSVKNGSYELLKIFLRPFRFFSYGWFHVLKLFYWFKRS